MTDLRVSLLVRQVIRSIELGLTPAGIPSGAAVGTPTLGASGPDTLDLDGLGIASGEAVGSPSLAVQVLPDGIPSTAAVGSPALVPVLSPAGIASTAAVGSPGLRSSIAFFIHAFP